MRRYGWFEKIPYTFRPCARVSRPPSEHDGSVLGLPLLSEISLVFPCAPLRSNTTTLCGYFYYSTSQLQVFKATALQTDFAVIAISWRKLIITLGGCVVLPWQTPRSGPDPHVAATVPLRFVFGTWRGVRNYSDVVTWD